MVTLSIECAASSVAYCRCIVSVMISDSESEGEDYKKRILGGKGNSEVGR